MKDDIILEKIESIEHRLKRINEEYQANGKVLNTNFMAQDAIVLNLERDCELSSDCYPKTGKAVNHKAGRIVQPFNLVNHTINQQERQR